MKITSIYMLFFFFNQTVCSGQQSLSKFFAPGGTHRFFSTGRLRPDVQPLALLYTIFARKGTPFVYLLLTNSAPFTMPVFNMNQ